MARILEYHFDHGSPYSGLASAHARPAGKPKIAEAVQIAKAHRPQLARGRFKM